MKNIFLKMAVEIMKVVYLPFRLLRPKDRIVMISRQSDSVPLDFQLLQREFDKKNQKSVVLAKTLNRSLKGFICYMLHMLKQMYYISTSKVVVIDGHCILISVLPRVKNQTIVQVWHALGAVKQFGYQTINKKNDFYKDVARIMRMHRNYDYIIAPSHKTAEHFAAGFGTKLDKILILGLPRIDHIKKENLAIRNRIFDTYPQVKNKKTVLYAPTFRENSKVEIEHLLKSFDFDKYNLVLKKHWLDKNQYESFSNGGLILDKIFPSIDWLQVSDKVITDYSAIVFEAAIAQKEIYLYIKDIDEYSENTGLNIIFNEESIGKYAFENADDLCKSLNAQYDFDSLNEFREKYIEVGDNCTEKLADFLMTFIQEC